MQQLDKTFTGQATVATRPRGIIPIPSIHAGLGGWLIFSLHFGCRAEFLAFRILKARQVELKYMEKEK